MNTQQEYEKLKQEGISKILEDANGSWYDLVNDGFDLAKKLRQSTHPIAADAEILVPVPGQEDGNFRDGKEIKTWMDAWLIGYKTAMKEYASQPKGAGVNKPSEKIGRCKTCGHKFDDDVCCADCIDKQID